MPCHAHPPSLDEVQTGLNASRLYGESLLTDVEFDDVVVGCQRLEELLEILAERPAGRWAGGGRGGWRVGAEARERVAVLGP